MTFDLAIRLNTPNQGAVEVFSDHQQMLDFIELGEWRRAKLCAKIGLNQSDLIELIVQLNTYIVYSPGAVLEVYPDGELGWQKKFIEALGCNIKTGRLSIDGVYLGDSSSEPAKPRPADRSKGVISA